MGLPFRGVPRAAQVRDVRGLFALVLGTQVKGLALQAGQQERPVPYPRGQKDQRLPPVPLALAQARPLGTR